MGLYTNVKQDVKKTHVLVRIQQAVPEVGTGSKGLFKKEPLKDSMPQSRHFTR